MSCHIAIKNTVWERKSHTDDQNRHQHLGPPQLRLCQLITKYGPGISCHHAARNQAYQAHGAKHQYEHTIQPCNALPVVSCLILRMVTHIRTAKA